MLNFKLYLERKDNFMPFTYKNDTESYYNSTHCNDEKEAEAVPAKLGPQVPKVG